MTENIQRLEAFNKKYETKFKAGADCISDLVKFMFPIHPAPGESKETARPDDWMGKILEPGQRVEAPNMVIEVSRKIYIFNRIRTNRLKLK